MLTDYLNKALEAEGLAVDDFRELCIRLLNYGVLARGESQTEQHLYDRYLRIEPLVEEYLSLIGVRILHDRRFAFVRLYPPGARVPGMDDVEESAFAGGLRARLRQDEVALLLVLRLQYDQALREGRLDEEGYAAESMESLGIAMKNLLGRSLPDKVGDRRRILQRLRKLRVIDSRQESDADAAEAWLKIHPMIVSFVGDDALQAIEDGLAPDEDAEPAEEEVDDVS